MGPVRSGRGSVTLDQRVAAILSEHRGLDSCDRCLAQKLGVDTEQAARAAIRLGAQSDFIREQWKCATCGARTVVTRAIRQSARRPDRTIRSAEGPAAGETRTHVRSPSGGGRSGARILVVDDHQDTRELLATVLRRAGHETIEAADGEEAMRLYHTHGADLVVLDIFMPAKDGIETVRELRRESRQVKIIAISAGWKVPGSGRHTEPRDYEVLHDARECGADLVIAKPFDPMLLDRAVRELLQRTA
jgi:CheY-like chemotaxis protein